MLLLWILVLIVGLAYMAHRRIAPLTIIAVTAVYLLAMGVIGHVPGWLLAILWLLLAAPTALLLLPELTLLPYLIFGRSRFAGYVTARRQENRQMQLAAQAQGWPLATPADNSVRGLPALAKLTGMHCRGGNQVRLLINGDDTFTAILQAIRAAQSLVIVQFFIIRDDRLGRACSARRAT